MKRFEFFEIGDGSDDHIVVRATHQQTIALIRDAAEKYKVQGTHKNAKMSTKENTISKELYFLEIKQVKFNDETPSTEEFIWWVLKELCHLGWEPIGDRPMSYDSRGHLYRLKLEVVDES